jgi:HD-like signal output (HDOD) protein
MRTAKIARKIMETERADPALVEDAYTAAMLHDIGKLMLANNLTAQFQQALGLAKAGAMTFVAAEQEVFGANHAGVGAYLLGLWGMPATIVEAVAFHHQPGRADAGAFGPLTAVHVANVLEHEWSPVKTAGGAAIVDTEHLEAVGVAGRLDRWRELVVKLFQADDV